LKFQDTENKFDISNKKFNSTLFYKCMKYRVTKMSFRTKIHTCYKRLNTSVKAGGSLPPFTLHTYYQRKRINNNVTKYSIMACSAYCTILYLHINASKMPVTKYYFKNSQNSGTWVAQSVKALVLDFDSGHYLRVVRSSSTSWSMLGVEPA